MKNLSILIAGLLLTGCATLPSGKPDPRDPFERFNRSSFAFNDALDRAITKPAAKAYKKVTPRIVRTGVSNALSNLNTVSTIINDVLQGKMRQAGQDSGRFLLNSTLGLGGLFDPASAAGLENNDEDFGQTLGKWGVKPGPYLMLPFLGPTNVRDGLARIPDQYTYPVNYLEDDSTRYIIRAVDFLDLRAGLLDLDAQLDRSYDRYAFVRNAWMQRREFLVKDGNVDDQSAELEEGMEEDPAAPAPEPETPPPAAPGIPPQ
ncbi:MAG: VacJ family lipoprotein [Pseudomonadota bacterium]